MIDSPSKPNSAYSGVLSHYFLQVMGFANLVMQLANLDMRLAKFMLVMVVKVRQLANSFINFQWLLNLSGCISSLECDFYGLNSNKGNNNVRDLRPPGLTGLKASYMPDP